MSYSIYLIMYFISYSYFVNVCSHMFWALNSLSSRYFRKIMSSKSYCCFEVICEMPQSQCKERECVAKNVSCYTFQKLPHLPNTFDAANVSWKTELLLLSGIKCSEFACSIAFLMRITSALCCWIRALSSPQCPLSGHKGDFFVQYWPQVGIMGQIATKGPSRISGSIWICSSSLEFSIHFGV